MLLFGEEESMSILLSDAEAENHDPAAPAGELHVRFDANTFPGPPMPAFDSGERVVHVETDADGNYDFAILTNAIKKAGTKLKEAQERYKRNYDKRLQCDNQVIKADDHVYLRVERRDEKKKK